MTFDHVAAARSLRNHYADRISNLLQEGTELQGKLAQVDSFIEFARELEATSNLPAEGDASDSASVPQSESDAALPSPTTVAQPDADADTDGEGVGSDASSAPRRIRGEMIETTNRRNEVAALHASEPWLAPEVAAARLLMPIGNLRTFTQELGISWSATRPQDNIAVSETKRTLTERVRLMHGAHPTWTARMIANELGASAGSVAALLSVIRKGSVEKDEVRA